MNKICTTIEQSKKLIELGIDVNTADMYYFLDPTPFGNIYHLHPTQVAFGVRSTPNYSEGDIPAWSLIALNNIIKDNCERCEIHLRNDKKYNIFVTSDTFIYKSFDIYPNGFDELIDAYYEVVCWLKENNKL